MYKGYAVIMNLDKWHHTKISVNSISSHLGKQKSIYMCTSAITAI